MNGFHVLITGDYWHGDFSKVISKTQTPITLRPLESIIQENQDANDQFDAVVVALSRRNRFPKIELEKLVHQFVNTPVIALCGSWCEGEERSGQPVAGMIRVYWHQWAGRFEAFMNQVKSNAPHSWQLPKISNEADRILLDRNAAIEIQFHETNIGISANSQDGFSMLQTALEDPQRQTVWLENCLNANELTFSAICIDANSLDELTEKRIRLIKESHPCTPLILVSNFPRRSEFERASQLGVLEVVSKPFNLTDLQFAIWRCVHAAAA